MRRFQLLPVLLLSLALTGCAGMGGFGKSVLDGGLSVTATIQNPVTREQQAGVEATYVAAASGVVAYVRLRRCQPGEVESLTNLCSRWSVVQKLMTANRAAFKQLNNLRAFMANNETINAITAFNAARAALRDLKAIAFVNGIKVE